MNTFGFIGMGNMGYAMLKGALNSFSKEDIIFTCPSSDRREKISEETGVRFAESNAECANNAKYIILAVKPQVYDVVLKNIHDIVTEESIVISLAPGITITDIKRKLGDNIRVVRAMPNTPALVGEGMTGVSYNTAEFSFEERDIIEKFFNSFGKVVTVPESYEWSCMCKRKFTCICIHVYRSTCRWCRKVWNTEKRCLQACCTDCTWLGKNGS